MPVLPRFDLQDQVALVTGAARGLGRAIAVALAAAGADVALGLRDVAQDSGVAAEIEAMGRRALPLQMDLARSAQIGPAVAAAVTRFGRLDILVNNAGIAPQNPAEDVREEDLDARPCPTRSSAPTSSSGSPPSTASANRLRSPAWWCSSRPPPPRRSPARPS